MASTTIGIIGLGNLGTAVAHLLSRNGAQVIGWDFNPEVVSEVNRQHTNHSFLQDITLSSEVSASDDLEQVLRAASTVFVTLPSRFLQPVLEPMQNFVASTEAMTIEWVCMSKGVFIDTGLSSFQTLSGMFPDCTIAMLSGPSLANEFAQGVPTVVSVASASDGLCDKVSALLSNHEFSVVTSHDVIGVELGGVLKNVYAMGLGYFQAEQPQGFNFIGAYLSQALLEMKIVGVAMGAEAKSFNGVSGIGDLIATALSDDSHNAKFGRLLGQGLPLAQIEDMLGLFPEGFNVLNVVMQLADKNQLQLPLARLIHAAVNAEKDHPSCLLEFSGLFT